MNEQGQTPSPEVPDYCEPLLAYRVWPVRHDRLVSYRGVTWTPYERLEGRHIDHQPLMRMLVAWDADPPPLRCPGTPCEGHVPHLVPKCGIYGFKTRELLRMEMGIAALVANAVVGAVWLWGRVAEHEHGYRAQFAYPARLFYGVSCDAAAVANAYGIPYEEDNSWKSALLSDEWSSSLSIRPFPLLPTPHLYLSLIRVDPANSPPLSSQYLHQPSSLSLIKKPKPLYQQPTFNLHKPTHWYHDRGRKLWLRYAEGA